MARLTPERRSGGDRRLHGLLQLAVLTALVAARFRGFAVFGGLQGPSTSRLTSRHAVSVAVEKDVLTSAEEDSVNYTEKLLEKLPYLVGRKNAAVNFTVVGTDLGTEVKLSLPKLAYWQFVKGRGKFLKERPLPSFQAVGESLPRAKEAAAEEALKALFRPIRTSANSGNNRALAALVASMFAEGVEVADVSYESQQHESQKSPGNLLYALAYLSRQPDVRESGKRTLAVSSVSKISNFPWVHEVHVQDRQRLILPRNVSTVRVAVKTPPADLARHMEKELRATGAVSMLLRGTMAAQQAIGALSQLEYTHRFACYFVDDQSDANVTALEVKVARKWRPVV